MNLCVRGHGVTSPNNIHSNVFITLSWQPRKWKFACRLGRSSFQLRLFSQRRTLLNNIFWALSAFGELGKMPKRLRHIWKPKQQLKRRKVRCLFSFFLLSLFPDYRINRFVDPIHLLLLDWVLVGGSRNLTENSIFSSANQVAGLTNSNQSERRRMTPWTLILTWK